jgi:hypothetical protein
MPSNLGRRHFNALGVLRLENVNIVDVGTELDEWGYYATTYRIQVSEIHDKSESSVGDSPVDREKLPTVDRSTRCGIGRTPGQFIILT